MNAIKTASVFDLLKLPLNKSQPTTDCRRKANVQREKGPRITDSVPQQSFLTLGMHGLFWQISPPNTVTSEYPEYFPLQRHFLSCARLTGTGTDMEKALFCFRTAHSPCEQLQPHSSTISFSFRDARAGQSSGHQHVRGSHTCPRAGAEEPGVLSPVSLSCRQVSSLPPAVKLLPCFPRDFQLLGSPQPISCSRDRACSSAQCPCAV